MKSELTSMLEHDRETYEKFFQEFGLQLKFGLYSDFGMHKEMAAGFGSVLFFYGKEAGHSEAEMSAG